jgi:hypothetical protein
MRAETFILSRGWLSGQASQSGAAMGAALVDSSTRTMAGAVAMRSGLEERAPRHERSKTASLARD